MTTADAKATEKKPADLLARAREAARQDLAILRGEPEKPARKTILTGFRKWEEH